MALQSPLPMAHRTEPVDPQRTPKAVFLACLQVEGTAQRAAFVREVCGADHGLRERVLALLGAHDPDASFLAEPAALPVTVGAVETETFAEIGPYKLRERIGEGGFGEVWVADQREPVRRDVAVKVLKPGMDSKEVLARFAAERQALALMQHPGIAQIYDGGMTDNGRPYFVMELVRGVRIDEYCDGCNLSVRGRLELFVQVCRAVQHAHQKGLIHRDLKPTNILVAIDEGRPLPKVIDFGMAKALGQQLTDHTLHTRFAQMIGTPQYMSPEQAEMSALDVDTRSDVYSLGVLLYELLTGTTPLARDRIRDLTFDELRRAIREEEAQTPSGRVSTLDGDTAQAVAQHRRTGPRRLAQAMRGDLDWIVLRALEKDRTRRYEGVGALAADVERYLRDQPVAARPPSMRYRIGKFLRRNRVSATVGTSIVAVLVIVAVSLGFYWTEQRQRRQERLGEIQAAIAATDRWQERGDWVRALASAEHAAVLAGRGVDDATRRRVEQIARDARAVARLAEVQQAWFSVQSVADEADAGAGQGSGLPALPVPMAPSARFIGSTETDRLYAQAFAGYGLDLAGEFDEAAAVRMISSSRIRAELVEALDSWANLRQIYLRNTDHRPLLRVARAADQDRWRNRLRDLLLQKAPEVSWQEFGERQALLDLARELPVAGMPAATLRYFGEILVYLQQVEQAVDLLSSAQARFPGNYQVTNSLAWACTKLDPPRDDRAVELYSAAVALRPLSVSTRRALAAALERRGRTDRAIGELRAAIALAPRHGVLRFDLAATLVRAGELEAGAEEYHRAVAERGTKDGVAAHAVYPDALRRAGHPKRSLAAYRELDARFPDDSSARSKLLWSVYENGLREEARSLLQAWLTRVESSPEYGRKVSPQEIDDKRCFLLWHDSRWHELGRVARGIVERQPTNHAARVWYYWSLRFLGDQQGARAQLERVLAIDPALGGARNNLGLLELDEERFDEAIAQFQAAIRLGPQLIPPRQNLVLALFLAGRREEAKATLTAEPAWVGTHRADRGGWEFRAFVTRVRLESHPEETATRAALAQALIELGRDAEAIAELRRLLVVPEHREFARVNLAARLLALEPVSAATRDEAIGLLRAVLQDDGRDLRSSTKVDTGADPVVHVRLQLASALLARGDRDEAVVETVRALRADFTSVPARRQLAALLAAGVAPGAAQTLIAATRAHAESAAVHLELGIFLLFSGQPEPAAARLRVALDRDPKSWPARAGLGEALARDGDVVGAGAAFTALFDGIPDADLRAFVHCLQATEQPATAFLLADAFESQRPDDPRPCLWRGVTHSLVRAWDEAESAFREALRRDAGCRAAQVAIAEVLEARGDRQAAIRLFRELASSSDDAADHARLGQALTRNGEHAAARAPFRTAHALQRRHLGHHFSLVELSLADPPTALRHLRALLRWHPRHAEGLALLGRLQRDVGSLELARKLAPRSPFVLASLATAYAQRGDLPRALECGEAAVRLEPGKASHRHAYGEVLFAAGQYQAAIAEFGHSLRLATPAFTPAARSLTHRFLGLSYLQKSSGKEVVDLRSVDKADLGKAVAHLRESARLDPGQAAAHQMLAQIHSRSIQPGIRDLDAALRHAEANRRLQPGDFAAWRLVAEVHALAGRLPESLEHMARAVELRPQDCQARFSLGALLRNVGRFDDAIRELQRAVACEGEGSPAQLRGNIRLELAKACLQKQDREGLLRFAREGLRFLPDSAALHHHLAVGLLDHDPAGAVTHARDAVRIAPVGDSLALLAVALWQRNEAADRQEARRCFERAIAAGIERSGDWRSRLADQAQRVLGVGDDDLLALIEALAARHAKSARHKEALSLACQRARRWRQAAGAFQEALALGVDNAPRVQNNLAWLLATCPDESARDAQQAVEHASAAVRACPQDANYRNTLGVALYRAGRYAEAAAELRKSVAGAKDSRVVDWLFLAMALHRHGAQAEREEAREWLDKAVARLDEIGEGAPVEWTRFRQEAEAVFGVARRR